MAEFFPRVSFPPLAQLIAEQGQLQAGGIERGTQELQSGVQGALSTLLNFQLGRQKEARGIIGGLLERDKLTQIPQALAGGDLRGEDLGKIRLGAVARGGERVFEEALPTGTQRLADILPGLGIPKTLGVSFSKEKAPSDIEIDPIIRQSAEVLGYKIPAEMKRIQKEIGETLVRNASAFKIAEKRSDEWRQRIMSAGRNQQLLLEYRNQIANDFNLGPDQQQALLRQLDSAIQNRLLPGGVIKPVEPQQSGLPGFSAF